MNEDQHNILLFEPLNIWKRTAVNIWRVRLFWIDAWWNSYKRLAAYRELENRFVWFLFCYFLL